MTLSDRLRDLLCRSVQFRKLWGDDRILSAFNIEPDKRRQKKTVRELTEAGYVSATVSGESVATDRAWDEIPKEPVDLVAKWTSLKEQNGWIRRKGYPLLLVPFDFTRGEIATLLADKSEYAWYVFDVPEFNYGKLTEDKTIRVSSPGPLTSVALKRLRSKNPALGVSSEALRDHVRAVNADSVLAEYLVKNLPTGIAALLHVDAAEAEKFRASDEPDWLGNHTGNLGNNPSKWGETLEQRIVATEKQIIHLNDVLRLLLRVRTAVAKLGGWDVFVAQFTEHAKRVLSSQKETEKSGHAALSAGERAFGEPTGIEWL